MRKSQFFLLLFFLFATLNISVSQTRDVNLVFLETTDVHGRFFPEDLIRNKKTTGSLSQIYTYVQNLRNIDSLDIILLDNGDILQGTPVIYYANFESHSLTHPLAEMMNFMEYDAETAGNHDIETGHTVYDKYRNDINFPLLSANAIDSLTGKPYFTPYTVLEKEGVKIAILGLITPSIPEWLPPVLWSGMYFDDMIQSAKKWVKIIKEKEKPDVLIGLFHSGIDPSYGGADPAKPFNENASMLVADQVPGFDVVFCGHDHRKKTMLIQNTGAKQVLILNAGAHAANVARADIRLHWDNEKQQWHKSMKGSVVSMKNIAPDTVFLNKFNSWLRNAEKYVSRKITTLSNNIIAGEALYGPSAFVDMIHKAQLELTGATISFAAPFSITDTLKKGVFNNGDLFKIYKYENFLCTIKLKGYEIKNYLEYSSALWFDTCLNNRGNYLLLSDKDNGKSKRIRLKNPYYNFDSGAGIRYVIKPGNPEGDRVTILSMADGTPFDPDKTYLVALNSYRANGGGGHLTKGAGLSHDEIKMRLVWCSSRDFRSMLGKWLAGKPSPYNPEPLNQWTIEP